MPNWLPTLSISDWTPIYRRIVDAMAADIQSGTLAAGARLPPQRELAHALSVSVGAVTRAYDEAARRGLVLAHVGRGTFVADANMSAEQASEGAIDLSINTAPMMAMDAMIETIASLRRASSWTERLGYQPVFGHDADRRAAAAWLTRTAHFDDLDWRNVVCCSGAQNGMAIAFAARCKPGDVILCEAATFSGAKTLARQQGYQLRGVDMDAEGVLPDALDRAAATTKARVFYTLPTLQNPTARVMSAARRSEIAEVARARDLWIVEDDLYAPYASDLNLRPLASFAPERTLYVSSLSKIIAPGLRAGFLVAPAGDAFDDCARAMRALMHSPAGVGGAIATELLESGRADDLARDVRAEASARTQMALAALGDAVDRPPTRMSLHLWMPMSHADAERVAARALTAGVRLASPDAFAASSGESGLRLCVGGAPSRAIVERALAIIRNAISGDVGAGLDAPL